jgi:hypothetical protein
VDLDGGAMAERARRSGLRGASSSWWEELALDAPRGAWWRPARCLPNIDMKLPAPTASQLGRYC